MLKHLLNEIIIVVAMPSSIKTVTAAVPVAVIACVAPVESIEAIFAADAANHHVVVQTLHSLQSLESLAGTSSIWNIAYSFVFVSQQTDLILDIRFGGEEMKKLACCGSISRICLSA